MCVTVAAGCKYKAGYYDDDKKAALVALDVLHQRLSDGEFEAIYDDASPAVRARPKEAVIAAMADTRAKWGRFIKAEVKASSCFPNEVRFVVEAQFEKGVAGEMIIFHVPDDKAYLEHLEINPGPAPLPRPGSANECKPPSG